MNDDELLASLRIDSELVLRFLLVFSRFEYALKSGGYATTGDQRTNAAKADWFKFLTAAEGKVGASRVDHDFDQARDLLLNHPPKLQVYRNNALEFVESERRQDTDLGFMLRLVKTVRNNLFHGGKYQNGPVSDPGRDRNLLEACIVILHACLDAFPELKATYEQTG
jgi:hypothetical protein